MEGTQRTRGGVLTEAERDDAHIARLFSDEYEDLVRFAYLVVWDRELAEDLAQESFLRVWEGWDTLRNPSAAPAWLRSTVLNLARMSFRTRLRMGRARARLGVAGASGDADLVASLALAQAVAGLPLRQRACVVLRYFEDRSEEETARTLGVTVGTVKSQTHKAIRTLGRLLERE